MIILRDSTRTINYFYFEDNLMFISLLYYYFNLMAVKTFDLNIMKIGKLNEF